MAQQGIPPGRHSRGPRPGEAPYDGASYGDTPYGDGSHSEAPYGDGSHSEAPYGDASYDQAPYDDAPQGDTLYRASQYGAGPYDDEIAAERPATGGAASSIPERSRHLSRSAWTEGPDRDRLGRTRRLDRPDHGRAERYRPARAGWQQLDPFAPGSDTDTEVPPWAGPAVYPARSAAAQRPQGASRGEDAVYRQPADELGEDNGHARVLTEEPEAPGRRRGRAAAARLRKSRRRVYRFGGIAIAGCVVAAGIVAILTHHAPKPAPYVTSLQQGEFKSVPSACGSISPALLAQYLPGPGRTSTSVLASSTDSQCSFSVDAKPTFIVLEVQAQSFQPFAAATGDGSATANAADDFGQAQQGLAHPPKKSPLPPAQISTVPGLGQQAFMAFQNEHVTGIVTDVVTVVVRERNVVITVAISGQEAGHGFGPVPVATLQAGARAAAQAILARVRTQPTA